MWKSVSFSFKSDLECLTDLENLWVDRPKVVFERGSPGTWDEFGVRDPALLVDARGYLCHENNAMVLYFTGSHNEGLWQGIGRAVSFDEGWTWHRSPNEPVLAPRKGAWDSAITSTPWVIRDDKGFYRLYYRGASTFLKDEAIGLAVSRDGIHFERVGSKPILTGRDFADIPKDEPMFMGVVNVCCMLDGRYLLSFEGSAMSYGRLAQIFGAVSDDGEFFRPLNKGYPIFTAKHVRSWPVQRVANPRIFTFKYKDRELYMITFNAHYHSGFYASGLAFSRDLKEWWEHPCNPLILPSGIPLDDPFSGRIEGGVVVKEDLERGRNPIRIFLMGIPRRGPSHKDGVIGLAQGWRDDPRSRYTFRSVSSQPADITILPIQEGKSETLCLRQSAASPFPTQVHFPIFDQGSLQGLALEIFIDPDDKGSAFLILSEDMFSVNGIEGIRFGFNRGRLYLLADRQWKKLHRYLHNTFFRHNITRCCWLGWHALGICKQGVWHTLQIEKEKGMLTLKLDDRHFASLPEERMDVSAIYDIVIQSAKQPIQIRNLKISVLPHSQGKKAEILL